MATRGDRAEALVIRDGRVAFVGQATRAREEAGPLAEHWDFRSATVLPGFIDAHQHPVITALYGAKTSLRPPRVRTIADVIAALADAAERTPQDGVVVATEWDELELAERRPPTLEEVDRAVPNHPLFALHYTCHRALVNSRMLERCGITRATKDPAGGLVSRGRGGAPDGVLIERAMSPAETIARRYLVAHDADAFFERLGRYHERLLAHGITYVVDATVPFELEAIYAEADRLGHVVVPTLLLPTSATGWLEAPWDLLERARAQREIGPNLERGPCKLVFDGAPACSMCLTPAQAAGTFLRTVVMSIRQRSLDALRASLSVRPELGWRIRSGVRIVQPSEALDVARAARDRDEALAIHAIGNAAVELALSTHEARGPSSHFPLRIEHATFLSHELAQRIAKRNVAVVAQPHFIGLPAFSSAPSVPGMRITPLAWLMDAGVAVAGSSDGPVSGIDPLDGIRGAVFRKTTRGAILEEDQCIDLDRAVEMYTRGAAEVVGSAATRGSLEPGKRADLVVLDRPLDTSTLGEVRVQATVLEGRVAHRA